MYSCPPRSTSTRRPSPPMEPPAKIILHSTRRGQSRSWLQYPASRLQRLLRSAWPLVTTHVDRLPPPTHTVSDDPHDVSDNIYRTTTGEQPGRYRRVTGLETGEERREGRGVQRHKQMHQHSMRQHGLIADCIYDKQYAHSLKRGSRAGWLRANGDRPCGVRAGEGGEGSQVRGRQMSRTMTSPAPDPHPISPPDAKPAENPFNIRHVNKRGCGGGGGGGEGRGAQRRSPLVCAGPPRASQKKTSEKSVQRAAVAHGRARWADARRALETRLALQPAAPAASCPRWPCATSPSRSTAPCACASLQPGHRRAPARTVSPHSSGTHPATSPAPSPDTRDTRDTNPVIQRTLPIRTRYKMTTKLIYVSSQLSVEA
ncbi:hypothetical protein KGM_202862 [Danaus plexippus plexippus]|uniref:Uncharacterized protein n=1 Tax=Danaus plexippus plexippus TaxID=278856 RepID=A0A212F228_DANPL|nr:hypothetical protein KGM_202862 [Danaus plexippus plexippus]